MVVGVFVQVCNILIAIIGLSNTIIRNKKLSMCTIEDESSQLSVITFFVPKIGLYDGLNRTRSHLFSVQ